MTTALDDFQVKLLDETGVAWSTTGTGLSIDLDKLTPDQLSMLIGAGCFTPGKDASNLSGDQLHALHFQAAFSMADYFVQDDVPLSVTNPGLVLRRSLVQPRKVGGLDVLVYPITDNGVDTGMYKIAWGTP